VSVFRLIVLIRIDISLNNYFSYKASLITRVRAIYSTSIIVVTTIFCFILAQLITLLKRVKTILEVDL